MSGMTVLGTGIDLIENNRMREILDRWGTRLKDRVFLPEEQRYCESKAVVWMHYAARFAAKEAVSKAFGTGLGPHLGWLDVEVCRNSDTGAPHVTLSAKGNALAESRGVERILVSLSHTHEHSVAHAMLLGKE